MKILKNTLLALSLLSVLVLVGTGCSGSVSKTFAKSDTSTPASSGITVSAPTNGATVGSPFGLTANSNTCSSQPVTAMGYSFDDDTHTVVDSGAAINTQAAGPTGTHTLHVKAWGAQGASCHLDLTVSVTGSGSPEQMVPANATVVSNVQTSNNWRAIHDSGAGASSSGSTGLAGSPSLSGNSRRFDTSFSNYGGERYTVVFANDSNPTNFFYDAWVYLTSSATNVANLEMDMNQVMPNGQTVIYGFQCDGYSGTWDYTENKGTPSNPSDHWVNSSAPCNMKTWGKEQWHHIQVSYSRDNAGAVTYHSVWLDGVESPINATVPSAFALGWAPATLLTNFQVDGMGSGSNTVYLDKFTISRW